MKARRLFGVLVRLFFGRFFDNDLISPHAELGLTLHHVLALLAVPGLLVPFALLGKYSELSYYPELLDPLSWIDKAFFLSFSMVVMGAVTLLQWDALFPDRRDFQVLTPMPIPLAKVFLAQAAALLLFLGLFALDMNGVSTILYPAVYRARGGTLARLLTMSVAHGAATFGAAAFVFLLFVSLQGLLLNFLSYRAFRRISPYIQTLSLIALLLMFFLVPKVTSTLGTLKRTGGPALYALPPIWFLGLYETMVGIADPAFEALARIATRALSAVAALSVVTYLIAYRRHVRKSIEALEIAVTGPGPIHRLASALAGRYLVRSPVEHAVFSFTCKTIRRSSKHWLFLSAYVGVGFAAVVETLMSLLSRRGFAVLARVDAPLLSIQLVLSFFLISGLRFIFTIPAELGANWVFQLSEGDERIAGIAAARKAVIGLVAPVFLLLFPVHAALWGVRIAVLHMLFGFALSALLMEFLLRKFRKIPFTCSYLPGSAKLSARWFGYWFVFGTYAYTMAGVERGMLEHPARFLIFFPVTAALTWWLARNRNRSLADFGLVFEEHPEREVLTLNLST